MYITIAQARARAELGLSSVVKYPNALVEVLIKKAQAIVDAYMRQTIELTTSSIVENILVTPMSNNGLHIQLSRRFITEISEVKIQYGYGIDDLTVDADDYFYDENIGMIETLFGGCADKMFESEKHSKYKAKVTFKAGISPLPTDFLEAFYEVLYRVKQSYDADTSTESVAISNKIAEYRTLNEQVKFAQDKVKEMIASDVLTNAVENILNKYSMPNVGIGVYM